MSHVDLVVVGGGITGLAAAWEAHQLGASAVVLEREPHVGGKLRTSVVAGIPLDESADAFLARVPEAVGLCAELGLATELIAPATGQAYLWSDGRLRPLPEAQLLGVPTDLEAVAASGILSPEGLERARQDLLHPDDRPAADRTARDESIGELVRRRLGDEVLDRLVAPLVGGIWAGDCDRLSLHAATPAIAEAWARAPSLIEGAAAMRAAGAAAAARPDGAVQPVFLAPRGGMARLVDALADALGDRIRTGHAVEALAPVGPAGRGRWAVHGVSGAGGGGSAELTADGVVVATPAFAAASLVAPHCPPAGETLAAIEHASMVMVAVAVPRAGIDRPLDGSGFLVPPSSGRLLTACSWTSTKWPHLGSDDGSVVLLRAAAGRAGDDRALHLSDDKLVGALLADLADTMSLRAEPVEVRINRWLRSFPQPRPGHLDRIGALESDLARSAPGLAATGAWARGVGLPACIRAGRQAARAALAA